MIKQTFFSLTLITALLGLANFAHAEQLPKVAANDPRIQYYDYDPDTVYIVNAKVGYSSLIQFEKGEEIEDNGGLGMGDAKAWSLAVKGNNIFFKPIAQMPDTNMVIVTNKRTYAFQLTTGGGNQTYVARFKYPEEPKKDDIPKTVIMPSHLQIVGVDKDGKNLLIDDAINTQYAYRGNPQLKPTNAWDDGRFTYLKFAHAGDLPTVYRVLADGTESLVNTHTEADTLVLQEIGLKYRLRFGTTVLELMNQRNRLPSFNTSGASNNEFVRIDQ